jgi:hypothetical protein
MWIEGVGKTRTTQPGKFLFGCTNARGLALAVTLVLGAVATPVSADLLGGLGVDVDVGVGNSVNASVSLGLGQGGSNVGANVGVGGSWAGVEVSLGGSGGVSGSGGAGTPGSGPGVIIDEDGVARRVVASTSSGLMACAKDGNETAFNGYVVRDKAGTAIGWVHEATVSPGNKIVALRLQSTSSVCYKLAGGNFRIRGDEIWANVEAASFR